MRRRDFPIFLTLALASCTAVDRCVKTPKAAVVERVTSAARGEANPVETDIRVGLCGFRPARTTTADVVGSCDVRLHEEGDHGTGEVTAKLALAVQAPHTCEGTLRFGYRYHPAGKYPSYYELFDVARAGDPPPIVDTLERHATATTIDAKSTVFADGTFILPDGRVGAALAFDVREPGGYTIAFAKTYDASDKPVLAAYQNRRTLSEGDGTGALGFFVLEKGRAMLVATAPRVDPTEARVVRRAGAL